MTVTGMKLEPELIIRASAEDALLYRKKAEGIAIRYLRGPSAPRV